jgi:hypothetical protein
MNNHQEGKTRVYLAATATKNKLKKQGGMRKENTH